MNKEHHFYWACAAVIIALIISVAGCTAYTCSQDIKACTGAQ